MDIQFIKLSDNVRLGEGEVYQMVESTVYFEAYRHILEGLKEVEPRKLPLQVTYDQRRNIGFRLVSFCRSGLASQNEKK